MFLHTAHAAIIENWISIGYRLYRVLVVVALALKVGVAFDAAGSSVDVFSKTCKNKMLLI